MKLFHLLLLALWVAQSTFAVEFNRSQAGTVARTVGRMLEVFHYRQAKFDDRISQIFLKNYLDSLDPNHLFFLQSDVDEFNAKYGKALDTLTKGGDASPGFDIFEKFLVRLDEANALAQEFLKQKYDFNEDESYALGRNKLPWPADDKERRQLWRLRIKFDLLQERLAQQQAAKDRAEAAAKATNSVTSVKSDGNKSDKVAAKTPPPPAKPEDTLKLISKRYTRLAKTMKDSDSEEILQFYLSALSRAYDPHSDYMSPTEAKNFDINTINLKLSGIGALLRSEDGYTKVVSIVPGGPADLSKGLKPNDKIIAVGQGDAEPVETGEMKLSKVVDMIRGERGTSVHLTIVPADSPDDSVKNELHLIRDEIKLTEQFAKAKIVEHKDAEGKTLRLGLVELPQFYDNCAHDVEKLIERLKSEKIDGLALDLRRNSGGLLNEAVALGELFVDKAPIVQVLDSRNQRQILKDTDVKVAYDGPLLVLVSRLSASASEIVAAALQDYGRAVVVGDQTTHGKGTVQSVLNLSQFISTERVPEPGKLKLTVSKFYRVDGTTTQLVGVTPDIILPSRYDYMDIGEASLPNCLTNTPTDPLEHANLGRVKPYVSELRAKSEKRVKTSKQFAFVNEDIELLKKQKLEKSVSLNEAARIKERDELKAKADLRKKEQAALKKERTDTVYEISLDMVDKNKPISPLSAVRSKDNADLASAANKRPVDAADPTDDADPQSDPLNDPHLDEEVNILSDYIQMNPTSQSKGKSEKLVHTDGRTK